MYAWEGYPIQEYRNPQKDCVNGTLRSTFIGKSFKKVFTKRADKPYSDKTQGDKTGQQNVKINIAIVQTYSHTEN
jgi:hypothetical protein